MEAVYRALLGSNSRSLPFRTPRMSAEVARPSLDGLRPRASIDDGPKHLSFRVRPIGPIAESAPSDGAHKASTGLGPTLLLAHRGASMPLLPQRPSLDIQNFNAEGNSSWIINLETVELKKKIGSGSMGTTWLADWQATEVAAKVLDCLEEYVELDDIHGVMEAEVANASSLRHPNVALFMGICLARPLILLVEYCARGSLADILGKARMVPTLGHHLTWPRLMAIALDAAKGMLQLHSHRPIMLHQDLKSSNLVIDRYWRTKITDFYLSRLVAARHVPGLGPDVRWTAPEALDGPHIPASDIFSFGLILFELLTWQVPWVDCDPKQVSDAVQRGERPRVPHLGAREYEPLTGPLRQLMCSCWAQDPYARPTFAHVVVELRQLSKLASPAALAAL